MQILGTLILLIGLWAIIDSFFAAINEKKSSENEPDRPEKSEIDHPPLFVEFWQKSFNFTGKTNRRDYWITVLQLGCIYLFLLSLIALSSSDNLEGFIESSTKSGWIVAIITFIPNLAIQVRRLNDIGKEPAWVLLSFVPFISLILIFWYAKPSLKNKSNSNSELEVDNTNQFNNLDKTEERLEKFKVMLEKDLITSEEYEKLKRKLLGL